MPGTARAQEAAGTRPLAVPRRVRALAVQRGPLVLTVVGLAVLYRAAAEIGYALQFAGPVAAIVWLPVGVGIAFLYLGGLRFWPGVLVGGLVANNYNAL